MYPHGHSGNLYRDADGSPRRASSRLVAGLLYGVQPNDPLTYAAVMLGLGGAALLREVAPNPLTI